MRVRVVHSVGDLAADLAGIAAEMPVKGAELVRDEAKRGNRIAAQFARESAGKHGKHYPRAFSAEAVTLLSWEYGPDAAKRQGGMSFEWGSRNQPPHLDLNRSADIVGPAFADAVGDMVDGLFW